MKLHYFQHVSFEDLARIKDWALLNNFKVTSTRFYNDFKKVDINSIDWLIVMGGPMNVYEYDKYPWLKEEKKMIETCIKKDKFVLGICLGAQLIADVLGARVYKNKYKEIGWFPINIINSQNHILSNVFPDNMYVFQWHGDTFDIPYGAIRFAASDACPNQSYIYENKVIGLQFHIESTTESIKKLIKNCKDEIRDEEFIQEEQTIIKDTKLYQEAAHSILFKMLASGLLKNNIE